MLSLEHRRHTFLFHFDCVRMSLRDRSACRGGPRLPRANPSKPQSPGMVSEGVRACLLNRVCVCIQLRSVLSSRNNLPLRIFNPQVTALLHLALYLTLTHLIYIFYTLIHARAGLSGLGVSWCIASQNSLA